VCRGLLRQGQPRQSFATFASQPLIHRHTPLCWPRPPSSLRDSGALPLLLQGSTSAIWIPLLHTSSLPLILEAASVRMATRDRHGGFGEPPSTPLQRYISAYQSHSCWPFTDRPENACNPQNFEPNLALNLEISDMINAKKGNAYGIDSSYLRRANFCQSSRSRHGYRVIHQRPESEYMSVGVKRRIPHYGMTRLTARSSWTFASRTAATRSNCKSLPRNF
jgi:hypothetical protein